MENEINGNNLEQERREIRDLEVEIMIKEKKLEELKKAPWYISLISGIIGIASAFFLIIPAGVAAYQKNWVVCIVCLALFVIILVAWGVFLSYGTERGKQYRKVEQALNLAKKKKKQLENKLEALNYLAKVKAKKERG